MSKQQFNVTLPAELVRRVKHHSIDAQLSLSDLVAVAIETHLERATPMDTSRTTDSTAVDTLALQPIVHVQQMSSAVSFYEQLGGSIVHGSRDGDWVLMRVGGAEIGLLAHPPNPEQNEGQVELNFSCTGSLDDVERHLRAGAVTIVAPVTDEGFGRQLQVQSPDGLLVKINQLEPSLYT